MWILGRALYIKHWFNEKTVKTRVRPIYRAGIFLKWEGAPSGLHSRINDTNNKASQEIWGRPCGLYYSANLKGNLLERNRDYRLFSFGALKESLATLNDIDVMGCFQ